MAFLFLKMITRKQFCRLLVCACYAAATPAWAEGTSSSDTAQQLETIEQSLKSSAEKQSAIAAEIEAAVKSQADISEKLIELAQDLDEQQSIISNADEKIKTLSSQAIIIRSDLASKQDQLSELLAGLQRLEQNPPPPLVVSPQDVLQALRGAMMFGAVVPEMRDQAIDLREQLEKLAALTSETEATRKAMQSAVLAANTTHQKLTLLQLQKKNFTIIAGKDLALEKQRAEDLAKQATNLKQLLQSLEAAKIEAENKKSAEAKARDEAEKQKSAAVNKSAAPLSTQLGKLNYPLQGKILKQFGDDNGLGSALEGLALESQPNQNVITPIDGKVEFAGSFRSYGKLLILNAGEGYLVLLAGMNQISAEMGQSIRAGEPVGTMGEGPSSVALIGGDTELTRPVLYIEFRKNNEPVDPSPWWLGGRKEAMK
jgi:murein hydrolase activator